MLIRGRVLIALLFTLLCGSVAVADDISELELPNPRTPQDESEARAMARTLAEREGILAGTSTGLNVVAALQLARELGPGHCVATVAVDTGLKYFAGDLFRE